MEKYVAVIQAGGKGTRMRELTYDRIPKPLLKLNGKPMIEWQMLSLKKYGITKFVIIVGHLGEAIEEYFGDGSKLGVSISYIKETMALGSAGSLFYLKDKLNDEDIILVFGDVMFELDWTKFIEYHESKKGLITLLVHPNAHPYDSDLLIVDENSCVQSIDSKNNIRDYDYSNIVNAGLSIVKKEVLNYIAKPEKLDFESGLVSPLITYGKVFAYNTPEYVKDAGTPERYFKAAIEQKGGVWGAKCLSNKQKAIFIDRDGTINVLKVFLNRKDDFEMLPLVDEAIKLINSSKYLAIVITNQPVIARGECTIDELNLIHKKLETILGKNGAFINDLFFCPHHPHKGYEGEVAELKIECECRKPRIGMIKKAQSKYNIDLSKSWFIGDTTTDIQTGINAGMNTILVKTGEAGNDKKYPVTSNFVADNLFEAVKIILQQEEKEV
ncbi:MAG: HAD-IIIA family hydrolase [Longibaculum sp.]